jgi:2-keto-4-pentenoate hydratase/2-oxohepta-3-ene-1,7-dioic acid hydratase in catechol pathway
MKLVTFDGAAGQRLGALTTEGVLDLSRAASRLRFDLPNTLQELIVAGPAAWDTALKVIAAHPPDSVAPDAVLASPLPWPVRLRDASLFLEHMEAALAKLGRTMSPQFRQQVIYYNADHLHVFGPGADIPWPTASSWIDYELEWAVVIGRAGVNIPRARAAEHIFGYTIFNDWSARDLQFAFMEAGLGPGGGKDFANSLGPCIVTRDEIDHPYALSMTARVNGELWSTGCTSTMYHKFEDAISQLSENRPLVAGEIIGSGTVLGGCGYELGRQLQLGDVVELEVAGIGVLRNRVVGASTD